MKKKKLFHYFEGLITVRRSYANPIPKRKGNAERLDIEFNTLLCSPRRVEINVDSFDVVPTLTAL
jgi:hypothetical protein